MCLKLDSWTVRIENCTKKVWAALLPPPFSEIHKLCVLIWIIGQWGKKFLSPPLPPPGLNIFLENGVFCDCLNIQNSFPVITIYFLKSKLVPIGLFTGTDIKILNHSY